MLPTESVQLIVTSPPYWRLRDYHVAGQMGREPTVEEYVAALVGVLRECRRILRKDGLLFLNLGDAYRRGQLLGIPWRVAFALQDDGWILRQEIIWAKPNGTPESVKTRPYRAHEFLGQFARQRRYHYDIDAIRQPHKTGHRKDKWQDKVYGGKGPADGGADGRRNGNVRRYRLHPKGRNNTSVWSISTRPSQHEHFAPYPPELIVDCIKAGCPEGGTVLDVFGGTGTTGLVAARLRRRAILVELDEGAVAIAERRISEDGASPVECVRARLDRGGAGDGRPAGLFGSAA